MCNAVLPLKTGELDINSTAILAPCGCQSIDWTMADTTRIGVAAIAALISISLTVIYRITRGGSVKLPPGPPGLPIIGNLFDIAKEDDPFPWADHLERFGPISSVSVFGKTVVVLNDLQTAIDLLDQRSTVYSGRPIFTFAGEMIGWDKQMIMSQNGPHFRYMRRLLKSYIGTKSAITAFEHLQETETRVFLLRELTKTDTLIPNLRLTAGAIALRISHGYSIETDKPDPLVGLVQTAAKEFYIATRPGAWLVDTFPILKHIPDWTPGAYFKRVGRLYFKHNMEQAGRPHAFVKRSMAIGDVYPSFTSNMLLEPGLDEERETAIKWAANSIYGGGTDPSVAALSTFFLLMIIHPDIQQRAREELDSVVGTQRLPSFSDRPKLTYVDALVKELLRWHPVGRIGIPHRAVQEDIYKGYRIPKDSVILPHMWNFTRDPSIYADPSVFNPSRFLPEGSRKPELDPNSFIFGFGRRACPGQDFANASMFITVSMTLSVFLVCKGKDANGVEIAPGLDFNIGTVCHPKPYPYELKCRSPEAEALIRSVTELDEMKQWRGGNGVEL
ncbi:cytochrome P450 [Gautieria morchelliformis]|nr:cytochrome P450 [Gautieria morchelliformis]